MRVQFVLGVLLMAAASLASIFGAAGVSAQDAGKKQRVVKETNAVPGNYRQLIARNIAAHPSSAKILKAQISPPGVWIGPFGLGSPTPFACARLTVQGSFSEFTYSMGYLFKNGQIVEAFNPEAAGGLVAGMTKNAYTCGKLKYGPFPELAKAPRAKS